MITLTEENIKKYKLEGIRKSLGLEVGDELHLNDCYLNPENYINNKKSKIKPADYKPKQT